MNEEYFYQPISHWRFDELHSELTFRVKHLMISNINGVFKTFDVKIFGDNLFYSKVVATIDASSVFTNVTDRDNHLRSSDFFNVELFPEIQFNSSKIEIINSNAFKLFGELTMNGVTNPIEMDVTFGGQEVDINGNRKIGFSIDGQLDRKAWDLQWNAVLDSGGITIAEKINFHAEIQFTNN